MILSKAIEGFLIDLAGEGYSPRTIDLYKYDLSHLVAYLGDIEVDTITRQDLTKFMLYLRNDYRPGNPVSGSWVDNHWKAIRTFYRFLGTLGFPNTAANLPRPKYQLPPVIPFSKEELRKIIAACKRPRDKALVMLLLDTGLRLGELCRLRVEDTNLATGEIRVMSHGSGRKSRARTVFLGKQARRALWQYLANIDDQDQPSLFCLQESGVQQALRRIGERAGVSEIYPHKFRHTFSIMYLRNGGDIFTLQRLLGHADLATVQLYLNLVKADIEGAHRRASPVDNL